MNQEFYHVSANPHVRAKDTTQSLMLAVIIALLPTTVYGVFHFGMSALLIVAAAKKRNKREQEV